MPIKLMFNRIIIIFKKMQIYNYRFIGHIHGFWNYFQFQTKYLGYNLDF